MKKFFKIVIWGLTFFIREESSYAAHNNRMQEPIVMSKTFVSNKNIKFFNQLPTYKKNYVLERTANFYYDRVGQQFWERESISKKWQYDEGKFTDLTIEKLYLYNEQIDYILNSIRDRAKNTSGDEIRDEDSICKLRYKAQEEVKDYLTKMLENNTLNRVRLDIIFVFNLVIYNEKLNMVQVTFKKYKSVGQQLLPLVCISFFKKYFAKYNREHMGEELSTKTVLSARDREIKAILVRRLSDFFLSFNPYEFIYPTFLSPEMVDVIYKIFKPGV